MSRRGWLLFVAMGLMWGIPYLLIKVAVGAVSPAVLVCARTGIGALLLLPIAARRGGGMRPLLPYWRPLLAYTLAEVTIPWFLLSDAEQHLSSSLSGLLVAAVPLAGAVITRVTGGTEAIHARQVAGLVVGFVGVGALLGLGGSGADVRSVAEIACVVVGYAVGPQLLSRALRGLPSAGVVAVSLVLTCIVYLPLAISQRPAALPAGTVLASIGALGVVCTAAAFIVFLALITEVGPVRATVITYVNPAVALLAGVVLLGEHATLGTVVGFGLILLGSYVSTQGTRSGPVPATGEQPGAVEGLQA